MEKLTITAAQENFLNIVNIVKLVTEENKVYEIEVPNGSAVLVSSQTYESLQETIELLSIPGFRESLQESLRQVANGETYSLSDTLLVGYEEC